MYEGCRNRCWSLASKPCAFICRFLGQRPTLQTPIDSCLDSVVAFAACSRICKHRTSVWLTFKKKLLQLQLQISTINPSMPFWHLKDAMLHFVVKKQTNLCQWFLRKTSPRGNASMNTSATGRIIVMLRRNWIRWRLWITLQAVLNSGKNTAAYLLYACTLLLQHIRPLEGPLGKKEMTY